MRITYVPTRSRYQCFPWPYAHLLINHFPVVLSISALAVAILALILGHRVLWQTAMGALTVAGLFIFPSTSAAIEPIRR